MLAFILQRNFMKKIFVSFLFFVVLFADNIKLYTFLLKENYKEYKGDYVIDRDDSNFKDIKGIGIELKHTFSFIDVYLNGEFSKGECVYDGAYQDETLVKFKQKDVRIYDISVRAQKYVLFLKLGYRFWRRGTSNDEGNYNEDYYWSYFGLGWNYFFNYKKININTIFQYHYALNPKVKVYLGNNPTLNLGDTGGLMGIIDIGYRYDNKILFGIFYKIDVWLISASDEGYLVLDNKIYQIYEPDSLTLNQYVGVYIQKSF